MWVEHPEEKEIFRVERHMPLMLEHRPIGSSRRLQLQLGRPPRPKRSLTPNRTLTRRRQSQTSMDTSLNVRCSTRPILCIA